MEDKTSIHIDDLQSMTEELSRRLHLQSGVHDDGDSSDGSSKVVMEADVTQPETEPEQS